MCRWCDEGALTPPPLPSVYGTIRNDVSAEGTAVEEDGTSACRQALNHSSTNA